MASMSIEEIGKRLKAMFGRMKKKESPKPLKLGVSRLTDHEARIRKLEKKVFLAK